MGYSAVAVAAATVASSVYSSNKAAAAARAGAAAYKPAPPPAPSATPATLAQAAGQTKANSQIAPSRAKAGGTIGAEGPQGLTTPTQTANLTLLGGTK